MAIIPSLIGLAIWVLSMIIGWRIMRAFESIAQSISKIAEKKSNN